MSGRETPPQQGRKRSRGSSSPSPYVKRLFTTTTSPQMESPRDSSLKHLFSSTPESRSPDTSVKHLFATSHETVSPDSSLKHLYARSPRQSSPQDLSDVFEPTEGGGHPEELQDISVISGGVGNISFGDVSPLAGSSGEGGGGGRRRSLSFGDLSPVGGGGGRGRGRANVSFGDLSPVGGGGGGGRGGGNISFGDLSPIGGGRGRGNVSFGDLSPIGGGGPVMESTPGRMESTPDRMSFGLGSQRVLTPDVSVDLSGANVGAGAQAATPLGSGHHSGVPVVIQQGLPEIDDYDKRDLREYVTVHNRLGAGSFGSVYRGTNVSDGAQVAIKVLKLQLGLVNSLSMDREQKATETVGQVNHPNIVGFFHAVAFIDRLFLVTQYSPIGDLYQFLRVPNTQGVLVWRSLEPHHCRHLITGIARGVQYMHSYPVAHGDLKPENVLLFHNPLAVDATGAPDFWRFDAMIPKLTDFGNSKMREEDDPPGQVWFHRALCSLPYAAPESYDQPDPNVDIRFDCLPADCYSVGACLLAMLLGAVPFRPAQTPTLAANLKVTLCVKQKQDRGYTGELIRPFPFPLKDLLANLLDPLPDNRMTAAQILSHQWIRQQKAREFEDTNKHSPYQFGPGNRYRSREI